jgi:hypothetical protein
VTIRHKASKNYTGPILVIKSELNKIAYVLFASLALMLVGTTSIRLIEIRATGYSKRHNSSNGRIGKTFPATMEYFGLKANQELGSRH